MAEGSSAQRSEVASLLRSVVQTEKDGIPVDRLLSEYRNMIGTQIPFRQLGYSSLNQMLRDMSDVVRLKGKPGMEVAYAVCDESTAHIASLVSRQKTSGPRRNNRRRPVRASRSHTHYFSENVPPRPRSRHPAHTSNNYFSTRNCGLLPSAPVVQLRRQSPLIPVNMQSSQHQNASGMPPQDRFMSPQEDRYMSPQDRYMPPQEDRYKLLQEDRYMPQQEDRYMPPLDVYTLPKYRYGYETPPRLKKLQELKKADKAKPPLQPQPEIKKPTNQIEINKKLLEDYAQRNGWKAPEYKPITFNKNSGMYYCSVKVGPKTYSSYPDKEEKSAVKATATVAEIAVRELQLNQGSSTSNENLITTQVDTEFNISCFVARIAELITDKRAGVFYKHLSSEYEQKYHEQLPEDSLSLLKRYSDIQIAPAVDGRDILYPPRVSGESTPKETSRRQSIVSETSDTEEYNFAIPPLQLPEEIHWDVHISYVKSSSEFAIRLMDYTDDYGDLLDRLNEYYENNKHPVKKFIESKVYAVNIEDSWHRGEAYRISETEVECYFIDHGDTVWVDKKDIQELDASFLQLPAQAVLCELSDYPIYDGECTTNDQLMRHIFDNTYVAEVLNRDDYPVPIILYDTSTNEDVNINQMFTEKLIIELTTPVLPVSGKFKEVFISFVTPKEDIYVVCNGINVKLLKCELDQVVTTSCEENAGKLNKAIVGNLYLAKYEDDCWYRAIVKQIFKDEFNKVELFYVDYGNTEILKLDAMCELDPVSLLARIPHQAIKCRLSGIPPRADLKWSNAVMERLQILAPEEQVLEMTVISDAQNGMPMQVSFIKRLPTTNEVVSINQTLAFDEELFEKDEVINNITSKTSELSLIRRHKESCNSSYVENNISRSQFSRDFTELHSSVIPDGYLDNNSESIKQPLKPPYVPEKGKYFEAHITVAATPHNFVCQPWSQGEELDKLTTEMQSFYNSEENIVEMHQCLIEENNFYAGKHTDNNWYRIFLKVILGVDPFTVSVYFVDYGDYGMLGLSDIQPLWQRFRYLPFQAIHATLAGISPIHGDWSPIECVQFKEMVLEKQFVCFIKDKQVEASTNLFGSQRLSVELIDTSTNQDIRMSQVLINKGIAKACS